MNENLTMDAMQNEQLEHEASRYLAKVMGWMFLGLMITAIMSVATLFIPPLFNLIVGNSFGYFAVGIAQFAIVIGLNFGISKVSPSVATALFILYSFITGITLCTVYIAFGVSSVIRAFVISSVIFLAMAIYGLVTHKDLSKIGTIAIFALFGVILVTVINIFTRSSMLDYVLSVATVLIFMVLTAFDIQKLRGLFFNTVYYGHDVNGPVVHKLAIIGALQLYLDFMNIFLNILRIFSRSSRRS